ncbi:hypothetical protein AUEXF2481DRAFT_92099 [Aureobasidium subglaciale EXF-2481]|uniref:Uncharacterized protein n=1 Tax=Aureobasidium subglaciale (strain EXF-2481) TaxID=1043005 RepID=A0A074Y0W1_AURSE|nr:uncharacterized protein AUEXF2481DRAFT_92099 [Aureobasidium subglaciale EXF-2481]KEQ91443.1 hypothetical protein AUEXF2481DRAFT_92099 [Aureobasidium subglaciale EXF-2481]
MGQVINSPRKPRTAPVLSITRTLHNELRDDLDEPWRISGQTGSRYYVRRLYRSSSTWHQYALHDECPRPNTHKCCKEPWVLFTCKIEPIKSRYHAAKIDKECRAIVNTLMKHRSVLGCDCNFEHIKTGRTSTKGSNICEIRSIVVVKAMKKHDRMCSCGGFDFAPRSTPEKKSPKPQKSAPNLHKRVSLEDVQKEFFDDWSDDTSFMFKDIPRKF